MPKISRLRFSVIFIGTFLTSNINAGQVDVSGYASLIGTKTDQESGSYWNEYATKHIDFTHRSLIGIQLNTEIVKDLTFSTTIQGKGTNDFQAEFPWFYASYSVSNNTTFQFGRLKVPFYMISDYIDIGHAYPWVTPPPEVYSTNIIESVDGIEFIYETEFFSSTVIFDTYVGSDKINYNLLPSYINSAANDGSPKFKTGDKVEFDSHDLFGLAISIVTDSVTFKVSHNQAVLDSPDLNITSARVSLGSFGIIVDISNFILYSEFTHRFSSDSLQTTLPDQKSNYITVGYRFSKFLPYISYASIEKGKDKNKYGLIQESNSLGIRYDVNTKMAVKFQATKTKPGFEPGDVGRYGLHDQEIAANSEPNVYSMSVDILF